MTNSDAFHYCLGEKVSERSYQVKMLPKSFRRHSRLNQTFHASDLQQFVAINSK